MLHPRTIQIVKSTAPLLEEQGDTLTRHFYQRMFARSPEVVHLFNPANQAAGSQQKALAGAICAYAANIDNLDALGGAVELIAQKHASLGVGAGHYPIVGTHLLASIREILGEVATDEVIAAWAEAYGFLADVLIGREGQIYASHAAAPGGWTGFKPFRLVRKVAESSVITSFYLQPVDGGAPPAFQPGQYLTVRLPHPVAGTTMRNYSLSSAPGEPHYRISVKREPEGFASNFLHDTLVEGGVVEVGPPCGEFFFDPAEKHQRPLVLVSAGVGITPTLSMLSCALSSQPGRRIYFVHGALNRRVHAFGHTLRDLAARHPQLTVHVRYSEPDATETAEPLHHSEGFIDTALLESLIPDRDADYYFCGPRPFMIGIYHQLLQWGIPASQVHFEFFGPRQELEQHAT